MLDPSTSLFTPSASLVRTASISLGAASDASDLGFALCAVSGPATVAVVFDSSIAGSSTRGFYDDRRFNFWNYSLALVVCSALTGMYALSFLLSLLLELKAYRRRVGLLLLEISGVSNSPRKTTS